MNNGDNRAPLFFDLSARAKFRLAGADRVRFLNGQITNDVRKTTASSALEACVLNAKGKLNGHIFIAADAGSFFLDTDPESQETLLARFDRYIIADDVQIADVTADWALFHLLAAPPGSAMGVLAASDRFGAPGFDLRVASAEREEISRQLAAHFSFCAEEETEVLRIERGLPRWGRELTDEIIPLEANLEARTVDFAKGCYIGQEVISRMKMSGQTNKRLCGFISISGAPLAAQMRLTNEEGKAAGWLTSACRSDSLGKEIALGFAKRPGYETGTRLDANPPAGTSALPVEVVALPFR